MKKFSNNFKKLFLLHFTRELILHSANGELIQLQSLVKEQVKGEKEQLIRSIKRNTPEKKEKLREEDLDFYKIFKKIKPKYLPKKRILTIPETRLPQHLQYLKPIPRNTEIDLDKLNPLIKDPAVKIIKCDGPDEHIFVMGSMGTKPTNIILSKEEIIKVIKKISEAAKMPIHEGLYRVVVGRLILSAIISEVVGSKFMIKKMLYAPNFQGQSYQQPIIQQNAR